MRAFIHSYRTISHRSTFDNGILSTLDSQVEEDLVHPNYKEIIPPALIRRMSKVIRMGVGMGIAVQEEKKLAGIIVGTGLGCLENTEKFMDQFVKKTDGILAPTAFIQSTHNTIAGQIGLILKDNCYNSTYTQRGLSFENALLDAMLLSSETDGEILVGGLDEKIDLMSSLADAGGINVDGLGEGGSFFRINSEAKNSAAELTACTNVSLKSTTIEEAVENFVNANGIEGETEILFGNSSCGNELTLSGRNVRLCYSDISGEYMTNSAFGLQLAAEILSENSSEKPQNILVVNNFMDQDLGLSCLTQS